MAQDKGTYCLSPIPGTHMMERDPACTYTLQVNKCKNKNLKTTQEGARRDSSVVKSPCCSFGGSGFGPT